MTDAVLSMWVDGVPATQGSTRAFVVAGRARVTHDNKATMPWRRKIARAWETKHPGRFAPDGDVHVTALFVMPRPPSHWLKSGAPRAGAPKSPRLDIDKLCRAVLDALTGPCFRDDSQVTGLVAEKRYQLTPDELTGVRIIVAGVFRAGEVAA